jgi:hypothetical protein
MHAFCAVQLFLSLALMDGAFASVGSIEEIVDPKEPCIQAHLLTWKPGWASRNVLQTPDGWSTALERGWTAHCASDALQHFCLRAGFPGIILPTFFSFFLSRSVIIARADHLLLLSTQRWSALQSVPGRK